jgi:hypothetical protein
VRSYLYSIPRPINSKHSTMVGLKRGRRSGGGECATCGGQYDDLLENIRKKHKGAWFTEDEVDGTGLLACACGAVSSNARGLSHHQK